LSIVSFPYSFSERQHRIQAQEKAAAEEQKPKGRVSFVAAGEPVRWVWLESGKEEESEKRAKATMQ
jgi:hypothetical protein